MQCVRSLISRPVGLQALTKRFLQTTSALKMPIQVGEQLPSVDLYEGAPDKKVNSSELKKGKVVIVGVPGAFTPTCSNDHIPGFLKDVQAIKGKGVSQVVVVSVNDPFVMAAWGKQQDPSGNIRFLADTGADFAKALDLTFDLTAVLGNVRCKRFALVVNDGKVTGINVEPDGAGLSCSRASDVQKLI